LFEDKSVNYLPRSESMKSIFVAIASYRDPECPWTVRNLFQNAHHPERVFVGICWQFISPDDDEFFAMATYPQQVRCVGYDARQSLGPCWAKSEAQKLWRGEDFLLIIDSHMRFALGWDVEPFFETDCFPKEQIKQAFVACNLRMKKYFINRGLKSNLLGIVEVIKLACKYDITYLPVHLVNLSQFIFKKCTQKFIKLFYLKNPEENKGYYSYQ